jgi:serine protease Do
MNVKQILTVVAISATTAVASVWGYNKVTQKSFNGTQDVTKLPVNYAGFSGFNNSPNNSLDFTVAATAATPAVVHIKAKTNAKKMSNNLPKQRNPFGDFFGGGDIFEEFFGPRMQMIPEQKASGSGVLISEDGYIVTNNHVVQGADEITVTLTNKKNYKATVVGTDANSDLAVIKIEGNGLPYLVYGNSDEAKLGQWVLAIGYPLNLDVTVTAGIVSAKARNIGIIGSDRNEQVKAPVESFIQTDAAVNPGNSGGALINTNGEFIGVNTAISSQNGSYIGYSYAIPINIVKKVVNDIIKYGTVQRAFIGITYPSENISEEQKKAEGIKDGEGVYVLDVSSTGAAANSGIKKGDFITKINDTKVESGPEMVEQIARFKPGDKVNITYTRDGKVMTTSVVLKNKANTTSVVKQTSALENIGAEFATVDKKVAQANEISGGVVVKKITGGSMSKSRIEAGFVIISVNGTEVKTVEEFNAAIKASKGTVYLEGIYPGYGETYRYPLTLETE